MKRKHSLHDNRKMMTLRMSPEIWRFVKIKAMDFDLSMNDLINLRLNKYKEKCEKKLLKMDTVVS